MHIYLDAAPIIYWVEKVPAFYPQVHARISQMGVTLVSSPLVLAECLVLPLRQAQVNLVQDFDDFFTTQIARLVPLSEVVCRKAAEIRATHRFRMPDAIHLATALDSGCDLMLTNDAAFKRFPDITVEVVS